jgi:hypothetical protein
VAKFKFKEHQIVRLKQRLDLKEDQWDLHVAFPIRLEGTVIDRYPSPKSYTIEVTDRYPGRLSGKTICLLTLPEEYLEAV